VSNESVGRVVEYSDVGKTKVAEREVMLKF